MVKKITLIALATILIVSISSILFGDNFAFSWSNGSQQDGYSGSPGDGNTSCATSGCHSGATTVTGWITSNIPAEGYTPGTAYSITCTVVGNPHGFEITSEKSGGTKVGAFSSASGMTLYNSNHALVSSQLFTTKTLTWTSPTTGNGPVTFYACFSSSKTNAKKCTLMVSESTVGIEEPIANEPFCVYPNPVRSDLNIQYSVKEDAIVEIAMYTLDGRKAATLVNCEKSEGSYSEVFNLNNSEEVGLYILEFKVNGKSTFEKIIVE